jgi:hypothetical protein
MSVEGVRNHTVETEREGALAGAARPEEKEPLALLPLEIESFERRTLSSDVPDGERLRAGEGGQTSRTRSRPSAK